MKNSIVLVLVFQIAFFVSCTKNDESTIVLLGTESYVENIVETIPDTLRKVFEVQFGGIPQGYVPPKVEGNFLVAPKKRCYSSIANWPLGVLEPNMYLSLNNQHNSVVELNLAEATETFTDTVYVIGHDNLFTLYYVENKEIEINGSVVVMERGILIKGEMCEDGIRNFYFANIVMDVSGDGAEGLVQPGQFFIYKDGDLLARKEEQ